MGTATPLGLDYAGGRPGGAAITDAGYRFVCRYLTDGGSGLPGKLLTTEEYGDLQSCGVRVVANWETTANRMLDGYNAGVDDARAADAQIQSIGHPSHRPVYFSADFDASPAQQAEINDYLRGCAAVIGIERVGVYGSYYTVQRCLDNHTATWAWQTMAWSGGQVEPRAHIVQRIGTVTVGGVDCDVNEAMKDDYGQHPGDDMGLTPEEHGWLEEVHHESTLRLQSRVAGATSTDTVLGYAANSDAFGYRIEQDVIALQAQLAATQTQVGVLTAAMGTLTAVAAATHELTATDVQKIFDTEIAKISGPPAFVTDSPPSE